MAVRLKDIAQKTGFSVNTVSLALCNSPRISGETRQLIRSVADQMHYVSNRAARSLVTRKSRMIGLIVREFNNVILNMVASKLEKELYQMGYGLILMTTQPPKTELDAIRLLEAQQVDGILMYPDLPPDKRLISVIEKLQIPVVMLSYGNYDLFTDAVYVDKEHSAYLATSYLITQGHRKIGIICGSANNTLQLDPDRFAGYCRALNEAGIPLNPSYTVMPAAGYYQAGYDAARMLHRRSDVTAIVGSTDVILCGAMHYYLNHGMRVPEDVSFVSNDSTEVAAFAPVPLTAIAYPVDDLVANALSLIMERIEKGQSSSFQRIALQASIDIRRSVSHPCE